MIPASTITALCDLDFGRSFLRFSSTRVNHTPRLGLAAACTLLEPGQAPRRYYMAAPCLAENMYVPRGMLQEPACEFTIIIQPGAQFLTIKRHASAALDQRSAGRRGEVMPTRDGQGATMIEIDVSLRRFARVTPVASYADFRAALLENRPMIGRTSYTDDDGHTQGVLEYPITTSNVAHDREAWQVDAGPLLFPALSRGEATGDLEVGRFSKAYLIYNAWDYAEAAVRQPTLVEGGAQTLHYSGFRGFACRNELFAAETEDRRQETEYRRPAF